MARRSHALVVALSLLVAGPATSAEAAISVVRVGESTWTSWEPRQGEFRGHGHPARQVRTPREFSGMRQNMDISHPVYRQ